MTNDTPTLRMIREVCALGRAELDRPRGTDADPTAGSMLLDGLQALDADGTPSDISLSVPLLAPRAPYFDAHLLDALDHGIQQVVVLGAGYDDRAVRFQHPGVRFFEVDLPGVSADKLRRLQRLPETTTLPAMVAIDLEDGGLPARLAEAGHDPARPTVFLAEHLLLFLDAAAVDQLFADTAGLAVKGSSFALTAEVHPEGRRSADVISTVDEVMFDGQGPLRSIRTRRAWLDQFGTSGWDVVSSDAVQGVAHFAVPTGDGDLAIQTQFLTAVR